MSASMNEVRLIGNLTKTPELRYIQSGAALCTFSMGINKQWKDQAGAVQKSVDFFDIVAWGKTAELVSKYLDKGSSCLVCGELTQDRWEDKNTHKQRSKVTVRCLRVIFLGGKKAEAQAASGEESQGEPTPPEEGAQEAPGSQLPKDDCPF